MSPDDGVLAIELLLHPYHLLKFAYHQSDCCWKMRLERDLDWMDWLIASD